MKIAALDLGSNTFLCLVAEVDQNKIQKIYADHVEVVRLGENLGANKKFSSEALLRADSCLKKFSEIIKTHKPQKILAMATSAARDAENQEELFAIAKKYQIPLEIIPGAHEANITYCGSTSGLVNKSANKDAEILVVDIGGGSTEFIFGKGDQILAEKSLDIGCVRLTEKFITSQPTSEAEIQSLNHYIKSCLLDIKKLKPETFNLETILGVAGTPTALAAAELGGFDADLIDSHRLTKKSLNSWLSKLAGATIEEKIKMGIPKGRADVIMVGVIILIETLDLFNKAEISVSTRGVRYGVALEVYKRNKP